MARCDGAPIVWPEPTHAPAGSREVLEGQKKPWRSAAEVIDWSLPCPSIFDTREAIREKYGLSAQRPLRPNTMRRVIRGVDKFAIKAPEPFLVVVNHAGGFRGQNTADPLQTVTAKHGYGVVSPVMAPVMIQYHTEQKDRVRGQGVAEPLMTIDASNRYGLAAASLVKYYGSDQHGQDIGDPLTYDNSERPGGRTGGTHNGVPRRQHWDKGRRACGHDIGERPPGPCGHAHGQNEGDKPGRPHVRTGADHHGRRRPLRRRHHRGGKGGAGRGTGTLAGGSGTC